MQQNPYESPRGVEADRPGQAPRPRSLLVLVLGTLALIPAGCIAGGVTCYSTGVSGELVAPAGSSFREAGWTLGIPVGLLVMGCIWYYFGRQIWSRRP